MSQRRPVSAASEGSTTIIKEQIETLSIDGAAESDLDNDEEEMTPLAVSAEERYQTEKHHLRLKHWRDSPFAAGLTEPTWMAERQRPSEKSQAYGDNELEPDTTGCLCISAQVCPLFGASRVGNMVVLRQSHEWVEEVTVDEETGERTSQRYSRPTLKIVMGPYWPMMMFVTYPLIFGVSGWAFRDAILPGTKPAVIVLVWFICTIGLITALAFTACGDPGILYRHREPPPQGENTWRWTDQAQTYRPRGSFYDVDTAVVVEGFDHT